MILFAVMAVFFYYQFKRIDWGTQNFYLEHPLFLGLTILLVPVNWFFEWKKWTSTVNVLEIQTDRQTKVHSFFAGIVTGMLTPNMLGNFIGRIYYFDRKSRVGLIILTLVTNYAQFIASIVFGILAILLLNKTPLEMDVAELNIILAIAAFVIVLLYFNFEWFFRSVKNKARIQMLIRNLRRRRIFRWKILMLSLGRHVVFTLQFLFMLHAFGEAINWQNIFWIWQVYLWVTLAPSLFLGKLAIRESISIWVLALAGMSQWTVLISSFLIWILNLFIPTIIGLIICKRSQ